MEYGHINQKFFNLYFEEWLPINIYHVFRTKESGVKNIEKLWDHGPHWP